MRKNDFTDFYYKNVATGEGCGCAEKVIDVYEFNRLAGKPKHLGSVAPREMMRKRRPFSLYRWGRKLGLIPRP